MKRHRWLLIAALAALALAACGAPAKDEPRPPEIAFGQDLCDSCGMLIDQPQYAAATITLEGAAYKFDDIGDMVLYHQEHPEAQVRAWFVHDHETEAWLRAETAFFVQMAGLHSPMGHGVAAFASADAAQSFADDRGVEVLSFDEMRAVMAAMDHHSH